MRTVIYARYSSENQRDASIEDQIRSCRKRIEDEGWAYLHAYTDRAMSGASRLRPGYQKLLEDARADEFDIVMAEALDRLSRDQEDIAALFKQLSFCNVRIVTLSEGEISELHVGLKGTMNALYLKDLALKTRRGLEGRVRQGKSGGGNAYGYDVVRKLDPNGDPLRGDRSINEAAAAVVRRIFEEFASGHSPRAIAKRLNADGIPGPRGRPWRDTTIRGHHARRTGILRNDLYVGRLVWNKQHYIKDPRTGKRLARLNPESEWIINSVPILKIIEQDQWNRVHARLDGLRSSDRVTKARKTRFWEKRRPKHLLTGLVKCGCCGNSMTAIGKGYLACDAARNTGNCSNRRSVRRQVLEHAVLDALKHKLMKPEHVKEFIAAFHKEVNRQRQSLDLEFDQKRRELAAVDRKLEGLYDAIADGLRTPGLLGKLKELEAKKGVLKAALAKTPPSVPRLHPNLAELYRKKVERLHEALSDPTARTEAAEILHGLIEVITVVVSKDRFEIELVGEIANMIELAGTKDANKKTAPNMGAIPAPYRSSVKVVAGAGFEPATFRL